ncbi:unnamed protein product [Caenorhabditis sp. 36 PRJEB53466]|nr:unnamed protein product [Caenorhabditis sp. 36 PRJEB53466]
MDTYWFSRLPTDYDVWFGDSIPPKSRQVLLVVYRNPYWRVPGFPMHVEYYVTSEPTTVKHVPEIHDNHYAHRTTTLF